QIDHLNIQKLPIRNFEIAKHGLFCGHKDYLKIRGNSWKLKVKASDTLKCNIPMSRALSSRFGGAQDQ
ncbi:hypothetical protein LMH81_29080, partial [Vibrio lentus]|uniref:hypothetical protein n=1 Tax=Vibrio lentus TaxID=136468 RepID=UPI001E4C4CE5